MADSASEPSRNALSSPREATDERAPSPICYVPVAGAGVGSASPVGTRAAALPLFDAYGNLPPMSPHGPILDGDAGFGPAGITATLADIYQRFVVEPLGSVRRPRIWDGWMRHRRAMAACGLPFVTLVGGSFLTQRFEPNDVDLCYLVDGRAIDDADTVAVNRLGGLTDPAAKDAYLCDVSFIPTYAMNHPNFLTMVQLLTYWSSVFGISREGRMRSFLIVTEQGTL